MPSFSPTFGLLPLAETQGWTDPNPLSGFGAAVTMAEKRLAIASPNGGTTSSGLVSIYDRTESAARWLQAGIDFGNTWTFLADIDGPSMQLQSEFGASIDFTPDAQPSGILIGAPGVTSGASPAGAAYFYRFDGGAWVQDGNDMQGGVANERFGASVGASANFRAVIGAPDNNQNGTLTGKVYIYEFQSPEWVDKSPQDPPLVGQAENSRFGASVDISSTGDVIAIGEPGANSFTILERDEASGVWGVTLQLPHRPIGGDLGSSVKVLSKDYIAVAAENAQQESGSVRVYAKDPLEGKWTDFGPIMYGEPGDRIGREGALDGGLGPDGPEVVVGTEQGFIKRFDLDAEQWFTRFEGDAGMPVVNAVGYTSGSVLAGSDGKVTYSAVEGFVPTVPTAPTATAPSTPSAPSATAPSAPTTPSAPAPTPTESEPPAAPATTAPSTPTASTAAPTAPAPTAALTVEPTAPPLSTVPEPQSPSPAPESVVATDPPVATTTAPVSASPTTASVPTAATIPPSTAAPVSGTLSPTLTKRWVLTDGPITVSAVSSGFGAAVALGNNLFAAGVPSLTIGASSGAVQSFEPDANGEWISESAIVFESGTAQFGAAVDIASTSLIVGDPETEDPVFLQSFGAAYVYVQQGNSWSALGGVMRPDPTPPEAKGRFGAAVATASSIQRVAIGAPSSNIVDTVDNSIRLQAGRVYTFAHNGTGWDQVGEQLWGAADDDRLGTSIDMTGDGNGLLVGAPGADASPGSVAYYQWSGTGWTPTFTVSGTATESLGTKVAVVSQDGSLLATSGQGVVRVYSQTGAQVGSDIVGVATSLTGANGRVIVGLSSGFRAYDFDAAAGDWVEVETGPSTSSPVISISTSSDASTVVAGLQSEEIYVFNLV
jgi:FG-GAP repeat